MIPHDARDNCDFSETLSDSAREREIDDEAIYRAAFKFAEDRIKQLESENAELIKFITECAESPYARVACLDWVRKHRKCSKP